MMTYNKQTIEWKIKESRLTQEQKIEVYDLMKEHSDGYSLWDGMGCVHK